MFISFYRRIQFSSFVTIQYCFYYVDGSNVAYDSPPERPPVITESEKRSCDVAIDDNTRIVLSLDIFHHSDETAIRVSSGYTLHDNCMPSIFESLNL